MEDFTNSSTDYSTACSPILIEKKNEFSEVLSLKKPAALQPSLPIVHCDAIYTVRAQNCPLKSNGQPVTKFMLFCYPAILCMQTHIFFRILKLHVCVQVNTYVHNMCGQKRGNLPFYLSLGRNHVHLTEWFGFVNRHLWLGNFGKRNRGLRARTLRLRYPKSSVTFPFS